MKKYEMDGQTTRVVLVDDHQVLREGLRLWLDGIAGVEVVGEAGESEGTFAVVRAQEPDIVLMDVVLPGLSGLEIAERLAVDHPRVRVIMMTAVCEEVFLHRALRAGAFGYILKDVSFGELELALKAVSQGAMYLSPAASRCLAKSDLHPNQPAPTPAETLTPRQTEILTLIAEGHSVKSIAHQLSISSKTVDMHKARLMKRLNLSNLPALVRYAILNKLVQL